MHNLCTKTCKKYFYRKTDIYKSFYINYCQTSADLSCYAENGQSLSIL